MKVVTEFIFISLLIFINSKINSNLTYFMVLKAKN